ncbi:hypothetical protein PALB_30960 [Pseudoalteromonas luteoviolacea B = ATCC 29581]|nr:hypothetical protein PALB_30960 [Pseudoalteromonas luteoviolacea B = ATCC 29581]
MVKHGIALLLIMASLHCAAEPIETEYYKCTTERGVVFSQFPCSSNAIAQKLVHDAPELAVPTENHTKTLNQLEKKQIQKSLERKIRAYQHRITVLDREHAAAVRLTLEKLERMMDKRTRRRVTREVKAEIRKLDKDHDNSKKEIYRTLQDLEKKLEKFSK